jgi:hypothetical protein
MRSHFLHLILYSALVSTFMAVLIRRDTRARWHLGLTLGLTMVGAALALAYLMYSFPR